MKTRYRRVSLSRRYPELLTAKIVVGGVAAAGIGLWAIEKGLVT